MFQAIGKFPLKEKATYHTGENTGRWGHRKLPVWPKRSGKRVERRIRRYSGKEVHRGSKGRGESVSLCVYGERRMLRKKKGGKLVQTVPEGGLGVILNQ